MNSGDWQIYDDAGRRKYLNEDERQRFLRAADCEPPNIRALCYLLCFTGCRVSEALALRQEHIDTSVHRIIFRTLKRRKLHFRNVPVPEHLSRLLVKIIGEGQTCIWDMHRVTAWRHVRRVAKAASIAGPMATARGCRHSFGIKAASASVPGALIQRWLGHASPSTTAIYLNAVGIEERLFAKRMWD